MSFRGNKFDAVRSVLRLLLVAAACVPLTGCWLPFSTKRAADPGNAQGYGGGEKVYTALGIALGHIALVAQKVQNQEDLGALCRPNGCNEGTETAHCNLLSTLSEEQVSYCRSFIEATAGTMARMAASPVTSLFEVVGHDLQVDNGNGSTTTVAARTNLSSEGKVLLNHGRTERLSPGEMISLAAHELGHKIDLLTNGLAALGRAVRAAAAIRFIDDNRVVGPFRSGRLLLDAIGAAYAVYYADHAGRPGSLDTTYQRRGFVAHASAVSSWEIRSHPMFFDSAANLHGMVGAALPFPDPSKPDEMEAYERGDSRYLPVAWSATAPAPVYGAAQQATASPTLLGVAKLAGGAQALFTAPLSTFGVGNSMPSVGPAHAVRLAADGSVDRGFGVDGVAPLEGTSEHCCTGSFVDSQGRLVAVSGGVVSRTPDGAVEFGGVLVQRYLSDGSVDTGFGSEGRAILPHDALGATSETGWVYPIAAERLPGDQILVLVGVPTLVAPVHALVRFRADGTLDPSFGTAGAVLVTAPTDVWLTGIRVHGSSIILLADSYSSPSRTGLRFGLLDLEGAPRAGFGVGGFTAVIANNDAYLAAEAAIVDGDGRLTVARINEFNQLIVMRFRADGRPDDSFGSRGTATVPIGLPAQYIPAMTISGGKLHLAIATSQEARFTLVRARLNY